jgi:hypothetical protein
MAKDILHTYKGKKGEKKFKLGKDKETEKDVDIDITTGTTEDVFIVDKLSHRDLDTTIDGKTIVWFTNFAIKKESTGEHINQSYKVTIPGLGEWTGPGKMIVIQDGNANQGKAYKFNGAVIDDTIELTDGDPGIGGSV